MKKAIDADMPLLKEQGRKKYLQWKVSVCFRCEIRSEYCVALEWKGGKCFLLYIIWTNEHKAESSTLFGAANCSS